MGLKNACFISYAHGEGQLMKRFSEEFNKALGDELEPYMDKKIYIDSQRLLPGYQYNKALACAICESVCMVAVIVPKYFEHDYCVKELATMEAIENDRRTCMTDDALGDRGLIIPVVLRGTGEYIPDKIKNNIHYSDVFVKFDTSFCNISKNRGFMIEIRKIAKLIFDIYNVLKSHEQIANKDCHGFEFPNFNIAEWKQKQITMSPFWGAK